MARLSNKTALITGGTTGIGLVSRALSFHTAAILRMSTRSQPFSKRS